MPGRGLGRALRPVRRHLTSGMERVYLWPSRSNLSCARNRLPGLCSAPVILGFAIAWPITKQSSLPPPHHSLFVLNLEISWSLFLLVAAFTHIASMDY